MARLAKGKGALRAKGKSGKKKRQDPPENSQRTENKQLSSNLAPAARFAPRSPLKKPSFEFRYVQVQVCDCPLRVPPPPPPPSGWHRNAKDKFAGCRISVANVFKRKTRVMTERKKQRVNNRIKIRKSERHATDQERPSPGHASNDTANKRPNARPMTRR